MLLKFRCFDVTLFTLVFGFGLMLTAGRAEAQTTLRYTPKPAVPERDPSFWITGSDYPARASKEGSEGVTGFRVTVSPGGRVRNCQITSSSGHADLDETTCALVKKRARFFPAVNDKGRPIVGTYSNRVSWSQSNQEPVASPPIQTAPLPPPVRASSSDGSFIPDDPNTFIPAPQPRNWQWSLEPTAPWVLITATKSGSKFYINQETFKTYSKTGWEFWAKLDATFDKSEKYRNSLNLYKIYCDSKSMKVTSIVNHDKFGNVIFSWNEDRYLPVSFEPIVPGTLGDAAYQAVCQ